MATVGAPATAGMVAGASAGAPIFPPLDRLVGGGIGLILGAVGLQKIEEEIFDQTPLLDDKTIGMRVQGTKVITEGLLYISHLALLQKLERLLFQNQTGFLKMLVRNHLRNRNSRFSKVK